MDFKNSNVGSFGAENKKSAISTTQKIFNIISVIAILSLSGFLVYSFILIGQMSRGLDESRLSATRRHHPVVSAAAAEEYLQVSVILYIISDEVLYIGILYSSRIRRRPHSVVKCYAKD